MASTVPQDLTSLINPKLLWHHRVYIAVCLSVALLLGCVYLMVASPKYEVEARLVVENRGQPLDPTEESGDDFLPTQVEIIRSPAVIAEVVDLLALPPQTPSGESQVISIIEHLEANHLFGTNVVRLKYSKSDPVLAVQTIKAIIDRYREYLRTNEQASHRETIALLTNREESLRAEMSQLHEEFIVLRSSSPLMGQDRDTAGIQRAVLTSLGESLTSAKRRRLELESHLHELHSQGDALLLAQDDTVNISLSEPTTSLRPRNRRTDWHTSLESLSHMARDGLFSMEDPTPIQQALLDAQSRDIELSKRFGPKHPEVRGVKRLIESLESRLVEIVKAAPAVLQKELSALRRREESLTEFYDDEFARAKTVDRFLVKERQQLDEIQSVQDAHDTIVAQLNTFRLANRAVSEGRASVTVRLLDGPELMNDKVWPRPVPLLALCGLIGLAGGVVLVVVREQLALARAPAPQPLRSTS